LPAIPKQQEKDEPGKNGRQHPPNTRVTEGLSNGNLNGKPGLSEN